MLHCYNRTASAVAAGFNGPQLVICNRFIGGLGFWVGAGDGTARENYNASHQGQIIGNRLGNGQIEVWHEEMRSDSALALTGRRSCTAVCSLSQMGMRSAICGELLRRGPGGV